jgi:hypothetical protein
MDKTIFTCGTAALGCVGQFAQPNTAEGGWATHQSTTDGALVGRRQENMAWQ